MNIQLVVQDNMSGAVCDLSELVTDISWETQMDNQPGKLTFTYIDFEGASINEGGVVSFKVDEQGVFFGYIFRRSKSQDHTIQVTAYDQMRYLKNKDTYVFENKTATEVFTKVCKDFGITHRVVDDTTAIIPGRPHDNAALYEIIDYGITQTLIQTGEWYIIRDNFGTLEFVHLNTLKTTLVIGDQSLALGYAFESSIDEDTYNQIKLTRENKETVKRDVYMIFDSSTQAKWGVLQYFEKVHENANIAQITEKAEKLLKLKNRVTKKLSLSCLGDVRAFAGAGIILSLGSLLKEGVPVDSYVMITRATHTFANSLHKMNLEVQVNI